MYVIIYKIAYHKNIIFLYSSLFTFSLHVIYSIYYYIDGGPPMPSNPNLIQFPNDLPLHMQLVKNDFPTVHWHSNTELIFVLYGDITLIVDDKTYIMKEEDICIINPKSNHVIKGNHYELLTISLQLNQLKFKNTEDLYFDLNSSGNTFSSNYDIIRRLIAQLVKVSSSGENRYMTLSLLYSLISYLIDNFQTSAPLKLTLSKENKRLEDILTYIDDHYKENLQLNDLAKRFSLTPSYLSSYFKKNTGMTFLDYYNQLRLTAAVNEMLTTTQALETIVFSNGFSDYRSFTKLFKRSYDILPSVYRKQHTPGLNSEMQKNVPLSIEDSESLNALSKYLAPLKENAQPSPFHPANRKQVFIDGGNILFDSPGIPLAHTFKKVCAVGSAKQFLYSEIQDMLRKTQQEIGYDFVKFHGILSDEMMVYKENEQGIPSYTFTLVDKVIDFLLSIDLRPFLQISFMPIDLASDPDKMIDMWHFNTSPPKNLSKWDKLIEVFVFHLISRYGQAEVCSWPFVIWNEPDGSFDSFGWENPYEFFDFYRHTYHQIKAVCPKIQVGTPSLLPKPNDEQKWIFNFFNYTEANDCLADFMNIHYYDNDFSNQHSDTFHSFSLTNLAKPCPMNEDPFAFTKFINEIKQYHKSLNINNFPIYLSEWNLTVSQRDLINDTCFKSCYLAKNLLENYDRLESFGYWVLSDFIEELPIPDDLFHGGLGLFTSNGIPKANYNVFRLINQLEDQLIARGHGYFITKSDSKITGILYNYEHFSKLFATGILFDVTKDNRYAAFAQKKQALFTFKFTDLHYNTCLIRESIINQEHGSSYDAWVKMGSRNELRQDELETIRQLSEPGLHVHFERIPNKELDITFTLEPLEVRLFEISLLM